MANSTIYSIGHGNKSIKEFINELNAFNIEYLFDIRSKPYSKYNPHYNQVLLEEDLKDSNITYVFLGMLLGGLPNDITCYVDGKVDYSKVSEKDFFKDGISLVVDANEEGWQIAMMCSESNPRDCHRSKLIGQELLKYNISIKHIISSSILKSQKTVIDELTKGKNLSNLFGEEKLASKKRY